MTAAMKWVFWLVVGVDALAMLAMIFADDSNQDAAGRGLQSGFGVIGFIILAGLAALYWFSRTRVIRVPVLILLVLPIIFGAYRFASET